MPAPDDVDEAALVLPMKALTVVTQPGAVKIVHRSGRVLYTLTGPTMRSDGLELIEDLCRVFDDDRRIAREVTLVKPWWRFW